MCKKLISGLLCVICICSLCACGNTNETDVIPEQNTDDVTEYLKENPPVMQIANPWSDCTTIEGAEDIAGFNFDSVKSAEVNSISVMKGTDYNIIQIAFYDGENKVTIRKANTEDSISGDYNVYYQEKPVIKEEVTISVRGNDNLYSLVEWSRNGYSYSISCEQGIEFEIIESYLDVVFE